jgi:hypothetical protein
MTLGVMKLNKMVLSITIAISIIALNNDIQHNYTGHFYHSIMMLSMITISMNTLITLTPNSMCQILSLSRA